MISVPPSLGCEVVSSGVVGEQSLAVWAHKSAVAYGDDSHGSGGPTVSFRRIAVRNILCCKGFLFNCQIFGGYHFSKSTG